MMNTLLKIIRYVRILSIFEHISVLKKQRYDQGQQRFGRGFKYDLVFLSVWSS